MDIYREIAKAKEARKPVAVAIITKTTGSTPRKPGAKMLVYPDGTIFGSIGGGAVEEKVIATAVECLNTNQTQTLSFALSSSRKQTNPDTKLDMLCGGNMEVYIEPIFPDPVLYIFGAGHISYALARIMKLVGFTVVVFDSDKHYANRNRFPESVADEVTVIEFTKAVELVTFDTSTYIVILTRTHRSC
ncbi:MAG: XdhC family protein, partial [bacterium]|nr:XdhC family protein [bacterium]